MQKGKLKHLLDLCIPVINHLLLLLHLRACNKGNYPLYGKLLVASAYSIPPFMYIDENNVILDGIAIRFLNTLASHFNFRYNTTMPGLYWKVEPDGRVIGSVGEVSLNSFKVC